eukprot:CAMPEP_0117663922 /NCGR_PEP_ID=MMETSP0804-20121206/8894_1 /TAXON_ID=1074897 /ORGANISM="Tetraselmis astigmatica, Strain CCMP880" /LENGTH=152 /DNA_ID=CAMNT_0005471019 /DNA_START=209 /DNA_END=667 /DNA_ORIENTATION=-
MTSLRLGAGVYSSRRSNGLAGNQTGLKFNKGSATVTMRKKDLHPAWFENSRVICNGEEVMTCGGTREEYVVDIWSGNHPFFQGNTSAMVVDEGRVNRFSRRYEGLGSLTDMSSMNKKQLSPEEAQEARRQAKISLQELTSKKGGKGKGKGKK